MRSDDDDFLVLGRLLDFVLPHRVCCYDAHLLILQFLLLRHLRIGSRALDLVLIRRARLHRDLAIPDRLGNFLRRLNLADERGLDEDSFPSGLCRDVFGELILKRLAHRAADHVSGTVFRALHAAHRERGSKDDFVHHILGITDHHEHFRRASFFHSPFHRALHGETKSIAREEADLELRLVTLHADDVHAVDIGIQIIRARTQRSFLHTLFAFTDEESIRLGG